MNHFLLAESGSADPSAEQYGAHAMEVLINGLLRRGAERERLEAKVFGGASLSSTSDTIGPRNVNFSEAYLQVEGIRCVEKSLGGRLARKVHFHPVTGRTRMMIVPPLEVPSEDPAPQAILKGSRVTLF